MTELEKDEILKILPSNLGAFINGRFETDGQPFEVINPATAEIITHLPQSDPQLVNKAVDCAQKAFDENWHTMSPGKRQKILLKLADLCESNLDSFAKLETLDNGVPYNIVKSFSAAALVKNLRYFAEWIDKFPGEVVPLTTSKAFDYAVREPYGVMAILTAYNTPSLFLGSKVGPALAMGNTVVIKPSPLASLTALKFAELSIEAGIPEGVVNVVLGGADVGADLVSNPKINKISFTGSRQAGIEISKLAAQNLTPVALELGGKSPDIIFSDFPINKAAMPVALGVWALSGQACVAGSRIYVEKSAYDDLVDQLVKAADLLPVGDPFNPTTVLGPLISESHRKRVENYIDSAKEQGATLIHGGNRLDGELSKGFYLKPAVIAGVAEDASVMQEEIFGPVACVVPFEDEQELIEKANNTVFGLAAGIWTRDISRAHRMAKALRAGTVWINSYGQVPHTAPFGGYKQSGFEREGGRWALELSSQVKNIYIDLS